MNALDTTQLRHDLEAEIAKADTSLDSAKAFREVEGYLRHGDRMLDVARRRLVELEAAYSSRRQNLAHRVKDDIDRLDSEHSTQVATVQKIISRLEAMRYG